MGWINFSFPGSATVEQEDAEIGTIMETGEHSITFPYDITLLDVVLAQPAQQNHEYSFWINGKKVSSALYSAELNPTSQTRFNIKQLGIRIPAGSAIQIKSAQLSEASTAAAEPTILTLVYLP